jgi:hypothetical protein
MSAMTTLRIAAVQASYVLMDRDATIGKVAVLTAAAAARGAQVIVFPEVFVPGTPIWIDTQPSWKGDEDWFALAADNAVVIPGPASEHLAAIAAEHQVWLAIGVQEREPHGSTIYDALLHFSPLGELAGRHRRLVPTGSERTVWGMGDGSTLRVIDTGLARIGGLIWRGEGRPASSMATEPTPASYPLGEPDVRLRAGHAAVLDAIGSPGTTLLDVRTPEEYSGERFWPSGGMEPGGQAGHIPGAVHQPIDGMYDDRGAFLDPASLRRVFSAARPRPRRRTDHLLHDRRPRQHRVVRPDSPARPRPCPRLRRVLGRMGQDARHPGQSGLTR